jgi:hypothetical protein
LVELGPREEYALAPAEIRKAENVAHGDAANGCVIFLGPSSFSDFCGEIQRFPRQKFAPFGPSRYGNKASAHMDLN